MGFDISHYHHLYPSQSHSMDLDGLRLHYLDEGQGEPVVMLHGNPTWSFMYRELAKDLRRDYRTIVPDHIGCGLSDKPGDERYEYTLERRVADLEALLGHLGLKDNLTLVLHDWGGMIGMAYASRNVAAVVRLVLLNTAAFLLPGQKLPRALRFSRNSSLAAILIRRFNAFAAIANYVCCRKKRMPPEIRKAFTAPYDSWNNRIATLRFVQDIPLTPGDRAYPLVKETQDSLNRFQELPMLILWGERDFVFDARFLKEWVRRFPKAEVHRFPEAGHYVLEDEAESIVPLVRDFLARHPLKVTAW